jgi:hypothetical protein
LRRFPFVFAGKDNVLNITSLAIFAIPTKDATRPVSLPGTLQVFAPTSATPLSATGEISIGLLRGRTFNTNNVVVAEKDEDAKWKLTLPAAAVAQFQRDIDEVLIVCQYALAKA